MRIISLLILFYVLSDNPAKGQNGIVHHGKIFFEQKVNTHKRLNQDGDNEWFDRMKDKIPKYKVTNYEFIFNTMESLYYKSKSQPDEDPNTPLWLKNEDNGISTIYKNMAENKIIHQKTILDKLFLIQDTMMHYKWTLSSEFRIIAGYNCRRASTIIMDSVYVIAFYADALLPSNGPLSFRGLPGTILGLVIPRLNETIFATKLELPAKEIPIPEMPKKGEKIDYRSAVELIQSKSNGSWMKKMMPSVIWDMKL